MEIPRYWRLKARRYRLEGITCPHCNRPIFPPRPVCPHCNRQVRQIASEIPVTRVLDRMINVSSVKG